MRGTALPQLAAAAAVGAARHNARHAAAAASPPPPHRCEPLQRARGRLPHAPRRAGAAAARRARRGAALRCAAAAGGAGAGDAAELPGPYKVGDLVTDPDGSRMGYRVEALLGAGASSFTYSAVAERVGDDADSTTSGNATYGERVALKAVRSVCVCALCVLARRCLRARRSG
jgi:hypothetical protein